MPSATPPFSAFHPACRRRRRVAAIAVAICWLGAAGTPAMAQAAYADLDAIDRDVAAFTGVAPGLPGGATMPVDRRMRLATCGAPIAYSWRGARHESVLVECPDPGSWHLYVAVRQGAGAGPVAVDRGESVTIEVTGDGFSVSQPGEAVDAGAVGEWIRVRAIKDGQARSDAVRARVVQPGMVEVPLP